MLRLARSWHQSSGECRDHVPYALQGSKWEWIWRAELSGRRWGNKLHLDKGCSNYLPLPYCQESRSAAHPVCKHGLQQCVSGQSNEHSWPVVGSLIGHTAQLVGRVSGQLLSPAAAVNWLLKTSAHSCDSPCLVPALSHRCDAGSNHWAGPPTSQSLTQHKPGAQEEYFLWGVSLRSIAA